MIELEPTQDHIRVLSLFIEGKAKCIDDVIRLTDYSPQKTRSLVEVLHKGGALLITIQAETECEGAA